MAKQAQTDTVEWVVDDVDGPSPASEDTGVPGAAKLLFAGLCVAAVVLGLFTLQSHERVQAPVAAPTAVPTPTLDLDAFDDPLVQARFEATLATLPELTVVLPQLDGSPAIRVTTGVAPSVDADAFVNRHSLAIDYSGQWVAGLEGATQGDGATLWFGPADGPLKPLTSGVTGFAWHDTLGGRLAVSAGGAITSYDFTTGAGTSTALIATPHHLDRWGSWGFVVRPERTGSGFHVLAGDGREIATGYEGTVVGSLNQRLIVNLAGGRRSPLFVFADTGQAWPVFALTDTQIARGVASGGFGDAVALHVSDPASDTHEIRIFPGDARPATTLDVAEQTGAMTWSRDRSTLYYLSEASDGATELFAYNIETKSLVATPIGASATVNHWASEIAVGREASEPTG